MTHPVTKLTDAQIEARVDMVENLIAKERDWKMLPGLNRTFDILITEQARRDQLCET